MQLEHKQRVWKGVGQVAKGRSWEILAPWSGCSVGPAEDQGQTPVLASCAKDVICRAVCSGVEESSSPHLRFAETEHKLSGLLFIPLQRHIFFSRAWKCTSTAQENHFPPSSPHEMKAVTGRILLFVDLGTWWNDSHRSEVNMFLRLLLFISHGFMGFPVHGQGNSSFTCVCADEL